jgi:hypothetical protein
MKKIILAILFFLPIVAVYSQAPQGINYQAVVRDGSGNVIASSPVGLLITIHQTTPTGTVVYSETFNVNTSAIGLVNVVIGGGTVVTGTFNGIDWSTGIYFCELGLDPAGGTSYTSMGAQQLMSVPYALFAENSNNPGPQGPIGNNGIGIDTAYVNNDSLFVLLTSGQTFNAGYVMGAQGPIGATGSTGSTGSPGTNGLNGIGVDTAYINNDSLMVLLTSGQIINTGYVRGPQGTIGITGSAGSNGTNGATWLTGTVVPLPAAGVNNDLYLNTANGNYYVKVSGSWVLQGNLTGPTGLLPNGTSAGNTPYWNGSAWITNSSNIFNNGGDIGVGTVSPQSLLHLDKTTASLVTAQFTNSVTGNTTNDGLQIGVSSTGNGILNYNETGSMNFMSNGTTYMQVNSTGKVAINGTVNTAYNFLVYNGLNPSIGVNGSSIIVGDVMAASYGNYFLTDFEVSPRFIFMGANVGIGAPNPIEALEIASGNVKIPAVNDYKYASAKTHYYSVPAASFTSEGSTYDRGYISGNIYLATGTATAVGYLVSPVHLPDGATVTSVTVYQVDNDGTYNLQPAQLWRNDASISSSYGNSVQMANIPLPASTNSTLVQVSTTNTITSPVIDNQNYFYYLRWGTQQSNANMRLLKVLITYTVTKVD